MIREALEKRTNRELASVYSRLTGESVPRFSSRAAALRRIEKVLRGNAAAQRRLEAIIAADSIVIEGLSMDLPRELPIPDPGDIMVAVAEREAILAEDPERVKAEQRAEREQTKARRRVLREVRRKKPVKQLTTRPHLRVVGGRVVRADNVERAKRGALCGQMCELPQQEDRMQLLPKTSLNYPRKRADQRRAPGPHTKRARLVELLARHDGASLEELMKEFGLAATVMVYQIRDLHYQCGYGLRLKRGRIYVQR